MKMGPAGGDAGVDVRFSRGEALMLSAGHDGAVTLLPSRYNGGSRKTLFTVGGYNRSGKPINFGTDDISVTLEDGSSLPVYDFDAVRHGLKVDADNKRALAVAELAVNSYLASRAKGGGFAQAESQAVDIYGGRLHSIAENLARETRGARTMLQTTTIDPDTYWAGWVVAAQPPLPPGKVQRVIVSIRFAGETHRFHLSLAAEGTAVPQGTSLPASTRSDIEDGIMRTGQTWLWDAPGYRSADQAAGGLTETVAVPCC
jgi:hypothetical protein